MPEDTYLLDVKVAFAQLVINCGARRLNLDPFQVLLGELFTYAGQATEPFRTDDDLHGWSTEDEFRTSVGTASGFLCGKYDQSITKPLTEIIRELAINDVKITCNVLYKRQSDQSLSSAVKKVLKI